MHNCLGCLQTTCSESPEQLLVYLPYLPVPDIVQNALEPVVQTHGPVLALEYEPARAVNYSSAGHSRGQLQQRLVGLVRVHIAVPELLLRPGDELRVDLLAFVRRIAGQFFERLRPEILHYLPLCSQERLLRFQLRARQLLLFHLSGLRFGPLLGLLAVLLYLLVRLEDLLVTLLLPQLDDLSLALLSLAEALIDYLFPTHPTSAPMIPASYRRSPFF